MRRGARHTPEAIAKMKAARPAGTWKHSPETIEKIRAASRAHGVSPQCIAASVASRRGKPLALTPEARARLAELAREHIAGKYMIRKYATPEEARLARNARSREKYVQNPDYYREVQRRWRERNRLRKKEISDAYWRRHGERLKAQSREIYRRPEVKAYRREYQRRHRAEHPDLYRAYAENRRARKLGSVGTFTEVEWLEKCDLFAYCCAYCGENKPLTIDHKTPLSRGGRNDIGNILPACRSCNSAKHDLTAEEFMARLGRAA